ncbi:MAG: RDD domain containing protein [Thermoanaerobacterales bacterium 50_218]|nr:MAG: RDD domain containing protein [Thermoanaerobacterales bacterium 50_218]
MTKATVGVWRRFVALFIDGIILYIANYFIAKPFGSATTSFSGGVETGFSLVGGAALAVILLDFAYFVLLEGTVGATLGKLILGMRVVMKDGSKCRIGAALIRNIMRAIDGIPYFIPYLLGAILIWKSPTKQRLGERVANTLVVNCTTNSHRTRLSVGSTVPGSNFPKTTSSYAVIT